MAVKFADFGKDAKDLLSKNYHNGAIKVENKTTSKSGVEFKTDGSQAGEKVSGGLEAKSTLRDGVTFTGKWNLNNQISGTLALDKLVDGLKTDIDASASKSLTVKNTFTKEAFVGTLDINATAGPTVDVSAVAEVPMVKGWYLGGKGTFDAGSKALTGNALAACYVGADYKVTSGICNMTNYCASIYHNVSPGLQTATTLGWGESAPSLTVGAKYALCSGSFVKAKIDNNLQTGLSYTTKLADGVQATLSGSLNGKDLNAGGHQFGASLNFSA